MPRRNHVAIESGPKGKKTVASAIDWPGWDRAGTSEGAALDTLEAYRARYAPVAAIAGLASEFDAAGDPETTDRYEGTGSTDFWGISFAPSTADREPVSPDVLERRPKLLWACWENFDEVAERVSPEMKKGPRGGGRSRDEIINHVLGCERGDSAVKVGVGYPPGLILDPVSAESIGRDTPKPSLPTMPKAEKREPGNSPFCFDALPTTPWTTPGKWKTRTLLARSNHEHSRSRCHRIGEEGQEVGGICVGLARLEPRWQV